MEEPISTQTGDANLTSERQTKGVEEYEQPRYSRRDTILTMAGVLMVMLLASLDQIIVSTAMPHDRRLARLRPLYLGFQRLSPALNGHRGDLWQTSRPQ